jgi:hypothetical protein
MPTRVAPTPRNASPYDAARRISTNTNRLNRSPVKKAPFTPIARNCNSE